MVNGKLSQAYKVFCFSLSLLVFVAPSTSVFGQETTLPKAELAKEWRDDHFITLHQAGIAALRSKVKDLEDPYSLAYRAKLALIDAELNLAEKFAKRAFEKAKSLNVKAIAAVYYAEALGENNKSKAAEKILRSILSEDSKQHRVRLALGTLLWKQGAKKEAEIVLDVLTGFFNKKLISRTEDFTIVSQALSLMGSYKDASYAMERAMEKDQFNIAGMIHWGNLFLEKYNRGGALELFQKASTLNAESVDGLIGAAKTELQLGNDYPKIREMLALAESLSPEDIGVHLLFADIAIKDSDCVEARRRANLILKNRPKQLEARTINATCAYLDDEMQSFEKQIQEILEINPKYETVFNTAADYGLRVHRYKEGIALNQRALKINPDSGDALLGIGIGLSRVGDEGEAHDTLKRAFEVDPYNVRTFNMLELYETELENYEVVKFTKFQLRTKKSETRVVKAVIAPFVEESIRTYNKQYQFEPEKFLSVEIFPEPSVFGVRSVGLPNITPQGVCFGNTVISRSPSEGNFNWAQVIWHEMAHVYHIQLSKNRVPRWFTEGLAEYETNIKDPSWARYNDRELSKALKSGELRGVLSLNKGFTHARSYGEILRSYQQASLVIHFIAETFGYETLPKMLRAWGAKKRTPEVIKNVLGLEVNAFDRGFEKWLRRRYYKFQSQFSLDLESLPTAIELSSALEKDPNNAILWAKLAVAKSRLRNSKGAESALKRALELGPKTPGVNLVAAYYYYGNDRIKDAYKYGMQVLDAVEDSYDLRYILGVAAQKLEKPRDAEIHFWTATQLWPDGIDAWKSLARIYKKKKIKNKKETKLYEEAFDRLFALQHHNPNVARQYAEYWSKKGDWKRVEKAAKRWFEINPFDIRVYKYQADAFLHQKRLEDARQSIAFWNIVRPNDQRNRILSFIELLTKNGYKEEALKKVKEAKALKIPLKKIEKALNP